MSDISDVSDVSDIDDVVSDVSDISDVSDVSDISDVSDVSDVEEEPEEKKEEPKKVEPVKSVETPKKVEEVKKVEQPKKVEKKTVSVEKKEIKKNDKKRPGSPRPKKGKKVESDSDDDLSEESEDSEEDEKTEDDEPSEEEDTYIEDPAFFETHKQWVDSILAEELSVVVNDPKTEGNRFQPFTTYKVSAKSKNYEVRRRFSEFDQLYNILTARYPGILIEPVPPKKVVGNKSSNFVYIRMRDLEHWINGLLSNPFLRADATVHDFLSTQHINWEKSQAVDTLMKNVVSFIPVDISKSIGLLDGQKKKQRQVEQQAKGKGSNDGLAHYNAYLNHIKCPEEVEVVLKSFKLKVDSMLKYQEKTLKAVKDVVTRAYGYAQAAEKMSKCFKNLAKINADVQYNDLKIDSELMNKNQIIVKNLNQTSDLCDNWYKVIQFMPTTAGKLLMFEMEKQLKQTEGLKALIERRFLYLADYTDAWHKKDAAQFEVKLQQKKGNRSKASKAKATLSDLVEQVESYKKRLERVTKALLKIEVSGYVDKKLKGFDVAVGYFAACNVLICREQEPLWMEFAKYALPDADKAIAEYKTQFDDMKNRSIGLDGDFDLSPMSDDSEEEKEEETPKKKVATKKPVASKKPVTKGKKPAKEESDDDLSSLSELSSDSDDDSDSDVDL